MTHAPEIQRSRRECASSARSCFPPTTPARTLLPMNPGADPADLLLPDRLEPADEWLMQAWIGGDVAAFELLYARHRGPLYRFLLRQTRNQSLAEEFFQDVWQRGTADAHGWKPEAAFSTWLFRIAHNRL